MQLCLPTASKRAEPRVAHPLCVVVGRAGPFNNCVMYQRRLPRILQPERGACGNLSGAFTSARVRVLVRAQFHWLGGRTLEGKEPTNLLRRAER